MNADILIGIVVNGKNISKSRNKMHTEMFLYILILNCSFLERVLILSLKIFIHWWDPEKCKTCVRMYPKDNWNYDFGYYL